MFISFSSNRLWYRINSYRLHLPVYRWTYTLWKQIYIPIWRKRTWVSFLFEWKASYKVHIYDLDTKQVIKTIHLQKEGRNAMPSTNGCFPLSSKHFLITTWNGVFGIINEKGEVENKNSFWKDSVNFHAFDHICCMSYTYRPAIIKDSILYFSQSLLKYPRKKMNGIKYPYLLMQTFIKKTRVDRTTIPIYF